MADIAKIVEELSNWSVMDIANLVKELETKWGVTAAAPVAAAAAAAAGAAAPAAEVKTMFDVILVSAPADKKIAAIKAVREVKAGLGLADAKALVEGAPKRCWKAPTRPMPTPPRRSWKKPAPKWKSSKANTDCSGAAGRGPRPAWRTVNREISIRSFAIVKAAVNRLRVPGCRDAAALSFPLNQKLAGASH